MIIFLVVSGVSGVGGCVCMEQGGAEIGLRLRLDSTATNRDRSSLRAAERPRRKLAELCRWLSYRSGLTLSRTEQGRRPIDPAASVEDGGHQDIREGGMLEDGDPSRASRALVA